MTADDSYSLLWFLGAFALVGSALIARQLKLSEVVKMALAWAAIFGLLLLVVRSWMWVTG